MFKNFIMTLKRYKVAGVLNILGLTLAFVAFYVIASQVWYSVTYNRPLKDSDRVYLVSALWGATGGEENAKWKATAPSPVTYESVEAFPQAENVTHFRMYALPAKVWAKMEHGDFQKFNIGCYDMSPRGVDVLGFDILYGDASKMEEPNTVIMSESAALRIGVEIGDNIYFEGGEYYNSNHPELVQTVVAIFKDFPKNTFLSDMHIFKNDNCESGVENNMWNYNHFIKFEKSADLDQFKKIWTDKYAKWKLDQVDEMKKKYPDSDVGNFYEEGEEILPMRLIPLNKIYYEGNMDSMHEAGSKSSTAALVAIACAIVIIAFINFINFFMALVPVRMRLVNICKVFGAEQKTLRDSFLFEAIGLVLVAFALAIGVIQALQGSFLTEYITCSIALPDNLPVLGIILSMMILLAVISALYPAVHITGFNASMGVKAGYGNSLSGRRMRRVLAGVQFAVAMVLIIVASSFWMQYRFMVNYDIGLDKDNVLYFSSSSLNGKASVAIEKLKQFNGVLDVTASISPITVQSTTVGRYHERTMFLVHEWIVRWNLPEFFGINLVEGEPFTDQSYKRKDVLVSNKLHEEIGMSTEDKYGTFPISGIYKDVRLASLEGDDFNTAFICSSAEWFSTYYVRIAPGTDIKAFAEYVMDLVQEISPDAEAPELIFFDQAIGKLYNETRKSAIIIGLFALLAMVIALMGVFGIVMFETQHRRSEIAIRKVYGAERGQLVGLLNNQYVGLVLVSFVVAAPVAWWIVQHWLERYANRIAMPWWIFVVALIAVLAITVALVTLRSWKAASENPVDVIKM